jgi:hypothetical protein
MERMIDFHAMSDIERMEVHDMIEHIEDPQLRGLIDVLMHENVYTKAHKLNMCALCRVLGGKDRDVRWLLDRLCEALGSDKRFVKPPNEKKKTKPGKPEDKRTRYRVVWNGERKSLRQWADVTGIEYHSLMSRYKHGWDADRMFTTPVRRKAKGRNATTKT